MDASLSHADVPFGSFSPSPPPPTPLPPSPLEIYSGTHVTTGEEVAMKFENVTATQPQLVYEARLYKILHGSVGIPLVYWYGVETFPQGSYNILVMDLLGESLEDLFAACGRRFSLKTVLMITDQTLMRLEHLHGKCE